MLRYLAVALALFLAGRERASAGDFFGEVAILTIEGGVLLARFHAAVGDEG